MNALMSLMCGLVVGMMLYVAIHPSKANSAHIRETIIEIVHYGVGQSVNVVRDKQTGVEYFLTDRGCMTKRELLGK